MLILRILGNAPVLALACLVPCLIGCQEVASPVVEQTAKELKVASNMLHPPFSTWGEEGKPVGIEVEIMEAAASELGWHIRWIEMPFPDLLDAVASGEIDAAVSTIGITEARKEKVAFSNPYFQTEIVAFVGSNSTLQFLEDFADKRIGADRATTSHSAALRTWPNATLVDAVEDAENWPQMLQSGALDAFVGDASDQARLESASGISMRQIRTALSKEYFGVAVAIGQDDLLAAVNRAIRAR